MIEEFFNHLNICEETPNKGDVLAIKTRKSGDKIILCQVKDVVNGNELILQKSTNSYFIWDLYLEGESWVKRVWNLGQVELTTSVNNLNKFSDY